MSKEKSVDKETLIEYQKFLIKNELMGSNAFYNAERFLSEIEPDNEKPYLFYEGEKYYFGEEYEFSDDGEIYVTCVFSQFDTGDDQLFYGDGKKDHGYFRYIRKIDHTAKYKKLFLELKEQAEKDGVNLKELL